MNRQERRFMKYKTKQIEDLIRQSAENKSRGIPDTTRSPSRTTAGQGRKKAK